MIRVPDHAEPLVARRDDPRHYTIPDLPREFAAFESPVAGFDVGHPGKVGLLELDLAPSRGATRITRHYQQYPLQVFRPVYLDPHRPGTAFVYVMSHGGVVQGDRYRLDVACAPGASVHLTTQSAAKIYRMEANYATQWTRLTAGTDSFLEYIPDPAIPYRDSRFHGRVELVAHPTATVIIGEILLPGRVAHGEHHDFTLYASRLEARSTEGGLLFSDSLEFARRAATPQSPGRLGKHAVMASLYVASRRVPARELADRMHAVIAARPAVVGGASDLPNGCGAWARILGDTSLDVSAALHDAWNEARIALVGAPAPTRMKG